MLTFDPDSIFFVIMADISCNYAYISYKSELANGVR